MKHQLVETEDIINYLYSQFASTQYYWRSYPIPNLLSWNNRVNVDIELTNPSTWYWQLQWYLKTYSYLLTILIISKDHHTQFENLICLFAAWKTERYCCNDPFIHSSLWPALQPTIICHCITICQPITSETQYRCNSNTQATYNIYEIWLVSFTKLIGVTQEMQLSQSPIRWY